MPSLSKKAFLDVGCNEGYFCGYAAFDGASRVVGLDISAEFIRRARARFPACEFLNRSWDELPEGPFDVILLASSLHYADDQPALIHRLVDRLTPDGVLVLELGIHPDPGNRWVSVERGIDTRLFPTRAKLDEVLAPYAVRYIGASVRQAGDPVPREVVHVSRRRPLAYLLLANAGSGKSSIARSLFVPAGVRVVSGDDVLNDVARGTLPAPRALAKCVRDDFSTRHIDRAVRRVFEAGLGAELVALWLARAEAGRDVAVDAFVPAEEREQVVEWVREHGWEPVTLHWAPLGRKQRSPQEVERAAAAYEASLPRAAPGTAAAPPPRVKGFVDEMWLQANVLCVRGWSVDEQGRPAAHLRVEVEGRPQQVEGFEVTARDDVRQHLGLADAAVGFTARVPLHPEVAAALDAGQVTVRAATVADALPVRLPWSQPAQLGRR